jgi:prepilin-type N-terminal cleavage/methylation domain-containing protein
VLQRAMEKKRAGEGGFTLIELMIVIVILGILAAIVVFAVGGITDRGETSACKANVKTAEVAVEAYYAKHGSYPADLAVLTAAPDKFLKSEPDGVTYDSGTGEVTGDSC